MSTSMILSRRFLCFLPVIFIQKATWFGFLLGSDFVQVDDARLEGDHERVEVKPTLPFKPIYIHMIWSIIIILIEGTSVRRCESLASQ